MSSVQYCPQCGSKLIMQQRDGRERMACVSDGCSYVFWDNPVPVVAAIVEYEGKVLLAHNSSWQHDFYALITGFLERGESPDDAIVREVKEELGVDSTITGFVGNYIFTQRNQLLIVYSVQASGEITLGEEIDRIKLLTHNEVKPWPLGTGPALRDWLTRHGHHVVIPENN